MTDQTERFHHRAMDGAVFDDCSMAGSRFQNVNLSGAVFSDVALQGARFSNINLAGASIEDANIAGLTIGGRDIQALLKDSGPAMATEPQLFVSDLAAACRFYLGALGFGLAFSHGEPAFYAQVVRGGWRLNLRGVRGPVFDAGFRAREADALSATLTLDDARPLFAEFQKAGVAFHQPLRAEPWGALSFIVRDPDGNLIAFAGRAGGGPAQSGSVE